MAFRLICTSFFIIFSCSAFYAPQAIGKLIKRVQCAHSLNKTIEDATSEKMSPHCAQAALDVIDEKHKGFMKVVTVFSGLKKKFNKLPAWQQNQIRYFLVESLAGNTTFVGRDAIIADLHTYVLKGKAPTSGMTAGACQTDLNVVVEAIKTKNVACLKASVQAMATVLTERNKLYTAEEKGTSDKHLLLNPVYRAIHELGGDEMLSRFMMLLAAAQLFGEQGAATPSVVKQAYAALRSDLTTDIYYNKYEQLSSYACRFEPTIAFRAMTGAYGPVGTEERGSVKYCLMEAVGALSHTFEKAKALKGNHFALQEVENEQNLLVQHVMRYSKKRIQQLHLYLRYLLGEKVVFPKVKAFGNKPMAPGEIAALYLNSVKDMQRHIGDQKGLIKDRQRTSMAALDLAGHKKTLKKQKPDLRVLPGVGIVYEGKAPKMHEALKAARTAKVKKQYHKAIKKHVEMIKLAAERVFRSSPVYIAPKSKPHALRKGMWTLLTQQSVGFREAIRESARYEYCASYVAGLNATYAKYYHPNCMLKALRQGQKAYMPQDVRVLIDTIFDFFIKNQGGIFYSYKTIATFNQALHKFIKSMEHHKKALPEDEKLIAHEERLIKLSPTEKEALAVGRKHSEERVQRTRQLKAGAV